MNISILVDILAGAGGRSIISTFSTFRNIGYTTFTKLFQTSISPVKEYAAERTWANMTDLEYLDANQ